MSARADGAAPTVTGAACQQGQGVTVVVDATPVQNRVVIGCAPGAPATVADAFTTAGVTLDNPSFATTVDGVTATYPDAYWSLLTSTADGTPAGAAASSWTSAQVGLNAGPTSIGQAYLLQYLSGPTYDAAPAVTLSDVLGQTGTTVVPPAAVTPSTSGSAQAAAGWIGRQLAAGGGVLSYNGATDWGKTEDALFALAAAGVGGDQIAATAAKIAASGTAYLGTDDQIGANVAAIAKTALALEVAGVDPSHVAAGTGTRDLLAQLRSVLNADGTFGSGDTAYTQAYVLLALARTDGGVPASALGWLEAQQCVAAGAARGSYGFGTLCSSPDADTTALVIQALVAAGAAPSDPAVADAVSWLKAQQGSDGGVMSSFGGVNANTTGVSAQAFRLVGTSMGQAGGYVGALQIGCAAVQAHPALTSADIGAIAYSPSDLADAEQYGIDGTNLDQFQRASAQALFAFGVPSYAQMTAQGATAGLPAAAVCAPAPSTPPSTPSAPAAVSGVSADTGGSVGTTSSAGLVAAALLLGFAAAIACRRASLRHQDAMR